MREVHGVRPKAARSKPSRVILSERDVDVEVARPTIGERRPDERRATMADGRSGRVVGACRCGAAGTAVPHDCVASGTESDPGRGRRQNGGNADCRRYVGDRQRDRVGGTMCGRPPAVPCALPPTGACGEIHAATPPDRRRPSPWRGNTTGTWGNDDGARVARRGRDRRDWRSSDQRIYRSCLLPLSDTPTDTSRRPAR